MARKKIVFIIVEGPSDEDALSLLFTRFYEQKNEKVYIEVTHGDITADHDINTNNIRDKIVNLVKAHAGKTFKKSDYLKIIHIIDTDGAFIPKNKIIEDNSLSHVLYSTSSIICPNKRNIEKRNIQKAEVINKLLSIKTIWKIIPYKIYYMSSNLDHVLYGKQNSSNIEKENDAHNFSDKYENDIQGFIDFISNSEFSVNGDYYSTWNYIKENLNSLNRHTNLGLSFQDNAD